MSYFFLINDCSEARGSNPIWQSWSADTVAKRTLKIFLATLVSDVVQNGSRHSGLSPDRDPDQHGDVQHRDAHQQVAEVRMLRRKHQGNEVVKSRLTPMLLKSNCTVCEEREGKLCRTGWLATFSAHLFQLKGGLELFRVDLPNSIVLFRGDRIAQR